jgi:hypothetical protein
MHGRKARHDDLDAWIKLRHALWPDHEIDASINGESYRLFAIWKRIHSSFGLLNSLTREKCLAASAT